ncbi:MAG: hypothetical protein KA368_03975 [Acidobacteria bacterium]|nr:hypothetical protein [Acidobacteriota bacterium]
MNKSKALALVFGVVVFLSAMTVNSAQFNYYLISPARISGTDPRPAPGKISGMPPKEAPACPPGANGISKYFNSLVNSGAYALAAF